MFENLSSLIYIDPTTVTFSFDLFIAIVLGTLIGIERESRGKDAGISTHSFVISGAMLFTFMSMTVDPASQSRIAAQVVSGIGFLGAGLILKDGLTVRNLTTAASIWFAGAIGMAIGFGYYQIAVVATFASIIIPRIPHVNRRVAVATISGTDDPDEEERKKRQQEEVSGAPTSDD
ncbi:MAG: MgtC/SapB family protein [Patescibacteria group bacterium]